MSNDLPEINYLEIGGRIRRARKHLHMTQKDLGQSVHLSTSFIGHVERGSRKASLETIIYIAKVLDASLDMLLIGEPKRDCEQVAAVPKLEILKGVLHVLNAHADDWLPALQQGHSREPDDC